MAPRSSSTQLPPVRRKKRRDWGRVIARVLCVLFAVCGLLPIAVGLVVRTKWARSIATHETKKILAANNVDATYDLELRLWPLSVGLENLVVNATDGGTPFLTARRVSARPKIFGLLAGKLVIDQIEIEKPVARVVLEKGQFKNLGVKIPESSNEKKPPMKPPFSVVSASEAALDVTIDGNRVVAQKVDADVTADTDGAGGTAFEVALRVGEARGTIVRTIKKNEADPGTRGVDEDVLCRIDGRARLELERKKILVRRFNAHGATDLDPAEGTKLACDLPKEDKRVVDVSLGHLAIGLPKKTGDYPTLDGHLKVRGAVGLVNRFVPGAPEVDGWLTLDAELRYAPDTTIPDITHGRLEATNLRVDHYSFARAIRADFDVKKSVVTSPHLELEIAEGIAKFRDVEVKPLAKGIPLKASVDITGVSFTELMRDLGVSKHPHVTWDLEKVSAHDVVGTLDPLHLDGDLVAHTTNFAVFDMAVDNPAKTRATGLAKGDLKGKLAVRKDALEFHNITVNTPHGQVNNVFVSIGFHEVLKVDVPSRKLDLADLSPLGAVDIGGVAEVKAQLNGAFGDPRLEGDVSIEKFSIGGKPKQLEFGNVTQGHVTLDGLSVLLRDIKATKGKSTYEMATGRLDFGGAAAMKMESQISSKHLDIRDFLNVFHLDEDPRFLEIEGVLDTNARMSLTLGGPEDKCKGGLLDVSASTNLTALNLLGEKFDEGHADLEYHWVDSEAGLDGADIDIRSLSLTKVKKDNRAALGSILGSLSVHRGGQLRGSLVVQGYPLGRMNMLGDAAKALEGTASGVARIGGTLSAYDIQADIDVTPVRILGAPFGGSNVHVGMTQTPPILKKTGTTPCGAPIYAGPSWMLPPGATGYYDKTAYEKSLNEVQGAFTLDGALFGGQVKLDHVLVTRQKAPIVNGRIELARFDLGPIGKVIVANDEDTNAPPLGGEISGELLMEKIPVMDVGHAQARFAPKGIRLTRGGQKLQWRPAPVVATLANDELAFPPMTFELAAPNGFKGAFALNGSVKKVTQGGELALDAELSPIDLGILVGVVPRLTRASGSLSGSVKIAGKASQPEFDGTMKIRRGEFGWKGLPGALTDVEIDLVADENEARITRAVGRFLGGDVSATARMPLKGGQIGVAEATVTARQLFVSPVEGVRATIDADLAVSLNPYAATAAGKLPLIGGDISVTSFEYTKPITIELNGITGGARRTVVEAYDPSLDAVTLALDVRSRAPLRIRNNLVDAQLEIDQRGLHVSGTNQRIGLRGEMSTRPGGHFRVFANDFEVQKGIIRFDDPTRIAPHVDITATTEYRRYSNTLATGGAASNTTGGAGSTTGAVSGAGQGGSLWRIKLHAFGDVDNLQVDMTSDPPLSREDIFFLLTIGLTRAEVDQVRYGGAAAGLAFETIGTASGVDRAVKQAIPVIDDFRPGTAYSPRTGRVEPNITVGRRLTDNVRARLTSGLAEDPQLRSTIEWRLNRSLTVEPSYDRINTVSSGNVGNFGVDFRWRLEFN